MPPLAERFFMHFGRAPEVSARAPGRVNLIGEHLDYNGGLVLPVPINRYVTVAAARRADREAHLFSEAMGERKQFRVGAGRLAAPDWSNYARGVSALLGAAGFDALVASRLPVGAGLSSSAALEVALAGALVQLFHLSIDRKSLALLCQKAEHRFAGVKCGIMDQMAAALARPGHALLIDCARLELTDVPLPRHGVLFAVCDTGVRRELASSEYNRRRRECERALAYFGKKALCEVSPAELRRRATRMPDLLRRRARHVVSEQARVQAAVRALGRSDFGALGRLLNRSHESLRRDYEVSCAELDLMVRLARRLPGVYGARMVGAGFGGAALALVRRESAPGFTRALSRAYREKTGTEPEITLFDAGR